MSIFVNEQVKTIEIDGFKIGIKELTYGQVAQINKMAMSINFVTKQPEIDLAVLQEQKLLNAIKFIQDPEGKEIKISLDLVRSLKPDVAEKILTEIDDLNDVSESEKKN